MIRRIRLTPKDFLSKLTEAENRKPENGKDREPPRVVIDNIVMEEILDLQGIDSKVHLEFRRCKFKRHINLRGAHFPSITFCESTIRTLDGLSLKVDQNLNFSPKFCAQGTIRLINANIGGRLNFRGARLNDRYSEDFTAVEHHSAKGSLSACGMKVEGSLFLDSEPDWIRSRKGRGPEHDTTGRFKSTGTITLRGVTVGGRLYFRGASLRTSRVLNSEFIKFLADSQKNRSRFLTEDYILTVTAIDGYQLVVKNSAHFSDGFYCRGLLRLSGARFGGKLTFKDAELVEYRIQPGDLANTSVQGLDADVINRELKEYPIVNRLPRGAIDAFGCRIEANVYFGSGEGESKGSEEVCDFKADGVVSFQSAQITGRVIIAKAQFKAGLFFYKDRHEKRSYSLDFGSAQIGGNFHVRAGCDFLGAIRFRGMGVSGRFSFSGSTVEAASFDIFQGKPAAGDRFRRSRIIAPLEGDLNKDALRVGSADPQIEPAARFLQHRSIDGAQMSVKQDVSIDDGAVFKGMVDFENITVGSEIKVVDATLISPRWAGSAFKRIRICESGVRDPNDRMDLHEKEIQRSPVLICLNLDGCRCRSLLFAAHEMKGWDGKRTPGSLKSIRPFGNVYVHHAQISTLLDIRGTFVGVRETRNEESEQVSRFVKWFWFGRDALEELARKAVWWKRDEVNEGDVTLEMDQIHTNWNDSARLHLEQTEISTVRDNRYSPRDVRLNNCVYKSIHRDSLRGRHKRVDKDEPEGAPMNLDERMNVWCARAGQETHRAFEIAAEDTDPRSQFLAQPYDQLAKVLYMLGNVDDSNEVIAAKIKDYRKDNRRWKTQFSIDAFIANSYRFVIAYMGFGMRMAARATLYYGLALIFATALMVFRWIAVESSFNLGEEVWKEILHILGKIALPTEGLSFADLKFVSTFWQFVFIGCDWFCAAMLFLIGLGLVKNYSNRSHGA